MRLGILRQRDGMSMQDLCYLAQIAHELVLFAVLLLSMGMSCVKGETPTSHPS